MLNSIKLQDISFDADDKKGSKVVVTSQLVSEKLEKIVDNVAVTRYIL